MIYVLYTTISNEKYKKLSDSAKVTYAILNDRVSLSIKNNWIDDNGDIYFIFINESLQNILDKSKNTITKIKKELQEVGLLEQIRTGFNRPNKLYLHDIETNISVEKNEQIRRYNRGEVSEVYNDKEKEQAQNAIRLLVQNANDQVSKNEQSYSILFDRYQCDVGYSEAKETIKNLFNSASTFGRKIQNDLLKNEIKRCQLKFYAKNYDENYQFRKEIESKGYSQQEFVNAVETNFKELLNEKNKLERREEKRKEIYQSAKDVYLTESEKNHLIVQQMYPKSHKQFSNDEKAFIVDEAQKGNFIKATNVQYQFKQNNNIPTDILLEDTYKKASKDIFFSERNLKNLEKNSFEYNVELQFIKEKEKEIDSYKEHIDNDLKIDIGNRNFEKVKDQTPNEKVQLLIKLEKYNNINQEEVIEKHIHQVDRNDHDNHLEHEDEQSNHINLPTINASDFLMYYSNETEKQNNINYKKKKKKQDRNNQMRR
ncbi:hypothetical protein W215_02645 [Staphylococcus aureus DAR1158]|nr:hypothetical protein W215_02645 [Staphylococcus aureus DAR1158]